MQGSKGFTLIELLVVLAILAILGAIVTPMYLERADEAREVVLRDNLFKTRQVIDQFYRDQGRYPAQLNELVSKGYIRQLPMDPILKRNDAWTVRLQDGQTGVVDIRSAAPGLGKDGTAYAQW